MLSGSSADPCPVCGQHLSVGCLPYLSNVELAACFQPTLNFLFKSKSRSSEVLYIKNKCFYKKVFKPSKLQLSVAISGNLFESSTSLSTSFSASEISGISCNCEGQRSVYNKVGCSKFLVIRWEEIVEILLAQGYVS